MDLSQPVTWAQSWGTWTFSPVLAAAGGVPKTGYEIVSANIASIPVVIQQEKTPLADGVYLSPAYLGGRTIELELNVYGASQGSVWDQVETLLQAFSPSPRPPGESSLGLLSFSQATIAAAAWSTGYIPLSMYANPIREPWHGPISVKDSDAGAHVMTVGATLLATDPFKYVSGGGISATVSSSSVSPTLLTYRGNASSLPTWWTIYHSGGGAGPSNLALNIVFDYDPESGDSPGGTLYIDMSACTAAGQYQVNIAQRRIIPLGGLTKAGTILATSQWGKVGTNSCWVYYTTSGTKIAGVGIFYPEAFY